MSNVKNIEQAVEQAKTEQEYLILKESLTAKTAAQRNEPVAKFAGAVTYGLQAVSIVLASGLIIQMYNKMPGTALLVVPACIAFLFALEVGKRLCIDAFNKSRLADSRVSYPSSAGMVVLTALSMYLSYSFTAPVIDTFSEHTPLHDTEQIKGRFKASLQSSLLSLHADKESLLKDKERLNKEGLKYDKKIGRSRLSSSAVVSIRNVNKELSEVNRRIEELTDRSHQNMDKAVAEAEQANSIILASHDSFNNGLSGVLSFSAAIIDLLLVLLASFVWSHKAKKLQELSVLFDAKDKEPVKVVEQESIQEEKEPVKAESKERVKIQDAETQRSTVAGFAGPRHGDMVDGKICIAVKAGPKRGELKKYDKRELQNLINNSSAKRAQELKPLLIKFD